MSAQPTTAATPTADSAHLATVKAKQQASWSSGDFSVVATRIVLVSEQLVESVDLRPGTQVLDVACGSGNATLAAARSGAHVLGVDYVPALLEDGRARAYAEGLDVEFREGDAEDLPVADLSIDATVSVFGTMFAPDHRRTAAEVLRVTRSGGTVGLASWTPDGFIGEMFRVITSYVPAPAGVQSPLLWGTREHLTELFGRASTAASHTERDCVFRFATAEEFVTFFRRWYGPTLKAFEALDDDNQQALATDLAALATRFDRNRDGRGVAIPSTYLESVIHLR